MTSNAPSVPQQQTQDASTPDGATARGGLLGLLTSLPGILTAVAGLVTAVTGAIGIYVSQDDGPPTAAPPTDRSATIAPTTTAPASTAPASTAPASTAPASTAPAPPAGIAPVPEGSGRIDAGGLADGLGTASVGDEVQVLMDDCAGGDTSACTVLLDTLAGECWQGFGVSCDVLYLVSAPGSAYEDYGATCGGLYDWTFAGACREL